MHTVSSPGCGNLFTRLAVKTKSTRVLQPEHRAINVREGGLTLTVAVNDESHLAIDVSPEIELARTRT